MAQTTYVSKVAVTMQTRAIAYERLSLLLQHLEPLNLNLVSVVRRADNFVEVTLNNPLPANQIDHLGLQEPV